MIFDCLTTISFFQLPINNTGATIESLEQDVLTQQTGKFSIPGKRYENLHFIQ
jgi:hypothetical protein